MFRVRKHAGIALKHAANDEVRTLLKRQNISGFPGDVDDDLKGYYLSILWPSHISFDELLPLKPPKRRNYTGAYKIFLEYELPKSLPDADLPRTLDWLRGNKLNFDILGAFGYLPSKLFARALTQMRIPAVSDAVLRLLKSDEQKSSRLFRDPVYPEKEIPGDIRMQFWNVIVQSDLDIKKLIDGDLRSAGMLLQKDSVNFIAEYRGSAAGRIRDRWRTVVFAAFCIEDAATLDLLSEIAQTDAAIAVELGKRTSNQLLPDEQNWVKKEFERKKENSVGKHAPMPSYSELVLHALDEFERGNVCAFWTIGELLDQDPDELRGMVFPTIQFSEAKAWKRLPPDIRRRILVGILSYLKLQPVDETQVWDRPKRYRPYDAVNPLLVLLFDEDRQALNELKGEDWSKWIAVCIAYSSTRNGSHEEAYRAILSLAYTKARQPFLAALRRYLEGEIDNDSARRIIWYLDGVWCSEIKTMLLGLLNRGLKPISAQDLYQLWLSREPHEVENLLSSMFKEAGNSQAWNVHLPTAITTLLTNWPENWGTRIADVFIDNPTLGHAVIARLICSHRRPGDWLLRVPPRGLVRFWEWLDQKYPGDPYDTDDGSGSVTIDHEIFDFRNAVFQALVRSGRSDACDAMVDLMQRRPQDFWLGDFLAQMRRTAHRNTWVRPTPSALMRLFTASERRLVRTAGELHGLVLESLHRFEDELQAAPPSMELWNESNRGRKKLWQPKDERNLSNCLKRFLERDLRERGLIANREVQITPTLGPASAQLVDLLVRAAPFNEEGLPSGLVNVVVEVKCAWNDGVLLDMKRQLLDRYLTNSEMHFGIYAVAYFTCSAWNWEHDGRKTSGESQTAIADLRKRLSDQAASLSSAEKLVSSIVIDARLNRS